MRLSAYIENRLGIRMPDTKRIMLESRLQKRLRALEMHDFSTYIDYVFSEEGERVELHHMFDVVTTNKTDFFREPDHFVFLLETLLPSRTGADRWGIDRPLGLWSAGCSSGEEPYTLAMILSHFRNVSPRFDFRIIGSDISTQVLERARVGVYRRMSG